MKKHILILGSVGLIFTGCADNSSSSKGGNPADNNTTQDNKESYRFVLNGCDTGKHDFDSNSVDDTKKQLCEALQDDKLNGSCAEALRKEFFNKKCSGYTWNPKYETPNNPSPVNPSPIDYATEEKVRKTLNFSLVDKYEVASGLSAQEKFAATQFAEDMMSCGLSYLGPKCIDYVTYMGNYGGSLNEVDGKNVFYSELKIKGTGTLVAFKFSVDQIQPSVKVNDLEIFKVVKPRVGNQSISEYLKDSSNLSLLISMKLAGDFQKGAWQRLQKPRDIRELYHLSKELLEAAMSSNNYSQTKNKIADVFEKNKSVVTQSQDTQYQEEALSFITETIQIKSSILVDICNDLLNSKSENIRQIAATIVLDAQPNRTELKPIVLKALNNQRWDIRKKAISALSKVNLTSAEENQVLSKIDDSDEDVQKAAIVAGAKINVSDKHLETVKELASSQNWATRLEAVKLLSRIDSVNSIKELIAKMDDSDEDVQRQVVVQLNQKSLGPPYVSDFAAQMESPNWSVRNNASKFLGKINANEATLVLIKKMDDSDDDVQKTIVAQLQKKSLNDNHVAPLSSQYKSQNWAVRRDVSLLLGKIPGLNASETLIKQMDDSDEDVRNTIVSQLSGRQLTNASVSSLKKNFKSQNWAVRRDVAKLLGKIKSADSLSALQDQLTEEQDEDVRKQIVASIKAVKN